MANPVILVVDDDPQVLRAVEREVRGRFGGDYRIVAAGSGPDALDADLLRVVYDALVAIIVLPDQPLLVSAEMHLASVYDELITLGDLDRLVIVLVCEDDRAVLDLDIDIVVPEEVVAVMSAVDSHIRR